MSSPTTLDAQTHRLMEETDRVRNLIAGLQELADRLVGPMPESGADGMPKEALSSSSVHRLEEQIASLSTAISIAHTEFERIQHL